MYIILKNLQYKNNSITQKSKHHHTAAPAMPGNLASDLLVYPNAHKTTAGLSDDSVKLLLNINQRKAGFPRVFRKGE